MKKRRKDVGIMPTAVRLQSDYGRGFLKPSEHLSELFINVASLTDVINPE